MTTVAVSGATGNVARRVVRRLAAAGVRVRAFTRDGDRARTLLPADVDIVERYAIDAGVLADCDALFVACGNGPRQEEVERRLILGGAAAGCRIVRLSSVVAAMDEQSFHRRLELLVESEARSWTHLRPSMFIQSLLTLAEPGLRDESELQLPLGDAEIQAVDVRDVADAAAAALLKPDVVSRAWTLAGAPVSMSIAASGISAALGRPISYVAVPDDTAAAAWRGQGLDEKAVSMLLSIFRSLRFQTATIADELHLCLSRSPRGWREAAREMQKSNPWRDFNLAASAIR